MSTPEQLLVRVSDDLVLDAGESRIAEGQSGLERIVQPPRITLFRQLINYLKAKPDPRDRPSGTFISREGIAAAAVTLRWGSYLAVLADRNKPVWREVRFPEASRISDDEMARINIESSAAMAEWIDLFRTDARGYASLVDKAVSYLPMPRKTSKPSHVPSEELLPSSSAASGRAAVPASFLASRRSAIEHHLRSAIEHHPSRMLANALINAAWRNGPVENLHAGKSLGHPLNKCRVTPKDVRELLGFASDRMARGMDVCSLLKAPTNSWPEHVLSYLALQPYIVPSGWTLTESSREIRLIDRPSARAVANARKVER
jgi:hypothetical protein